MDDEPRKEATAEAEAQDEEPQADTSDADPGTASEDAEAKAAAQADEAEAEETVEEPEAEPADVEEAEAEPEGSDAPMPKAADDPDTAEDTTDDLSEEATAADTPPSEEVSQSGEPLEAPAREPVGDAGQEEKQPVDQAAEDEAQKEEAPETPTKRAAAKTRKQEREPTIPTGAMEDDDEGMFPLEPQILVLKTQVGQERRVAENLANKARRFGLPIISLLAPQELRGYVFIETKDVVQVDKGIRGVSYARALIKDPDGQPRDTPFSEIQHFLTPVSAVAKIADGDIVELVSGPFRGEKAKVTRVDDAREEITVELVESMVPIPITVKGEHVRVLKKAGE